MTGYIILGIGIILFVLLLSMITINKGYAYKHTIDELPEVSTNGEVKNDREEIN